MADDRHQSTVGHYVTLQRGATYKSRLLGQPGPVLLGLASIQRNGGFRSDSLRTYGGASSEKLLVEQGDLFVSLKDVTQSADLLGAVARLPVGHPKGRLTQDTVKLVPKTDNLPLDYLYWVLRTPQYREYCRSNATGTTNLGLSRADFLAFPVPPSTPIRLTIADILGSLDDKIELNRRTNETLEAMARAVFKSWFVDFDPVVAKSEGRQPEGMDAETAKLFPSSFEDSEIGRVPKGWKVSNIGETCNLTMGQSPSGSTYNNTGDGIPFYQGRRDFGFRYPDQRVYCNAPTRIAQQGDTLVSVRAPVGDINMASMKCCIGRGIAAVRHRTKCRSYTYYSMNNLQPSLQQFEANGTVFGVSAGTQNPPLAGSQNQPPMGT